MDEPLRVIVYAICDECKLSAEVCVRDSSAENIIPEIAPAFCRHPPLSSAQTLSFDRLTPTVLLVLQESVGLFRSAGGLVLLSGGKLGPQIFLPLVRGLS